MDLNIAFPTILFAISSQCVINRKHCSSNHTGPYFHDQAISGQLLQIWFPLLLEIMGLFGNQK